MNAELAAEAVVMKLNGHTGELPEICLVMAQNDFVLDRPDYNSFARGILHVWRIKEGWQTAILIHGSYTKHRPFNTLEEVIKYYPL